MKLKLFILTALTGLFALTAIATVHNVNVASNSFTPANLTITQGDTVVWTVTSGSHNVNGSTTTFPNNPASFGPNTVGSSWTFTHTFTVAGTYNYQCDPHAPSMAGTVTVTAVSPPLVPCAKPFFSEYIEGSSNNKGLEIYNPSSSPLNLSGYKVVMSTNGGPNITELVLSGTVASGDVYVITNNASDPTMIAASDTTFGFPSVVNFNGDDAVFLWDTINNDTVDIIGVVGVDPGTSWMVGTGSTANNTLVRKNTITKGQRDWAIGATEWDVYAQNTYTFYGAHTSTCVSAPPVPCTKPFFSEYIEGSSNHKALEIYNPSATTLNLSGYKVVMSSNGGPNTTELVLSGIVASGDVYVIANNAASPIVIAAADTTFGFPSVVNFNGDDAVFLWDTINNDTVDIIGVVGVDPGTNWTVGTGATSEFTLVRKNGITNGQKNWVIGATEWDVYPQNTFTFIGAHTSTCIAGPANPTVNFGIGVITAPESAGSVKVNVVISPAPTTSETIDLTFALGAGINIPADGSISPLPNLITGVLQLPVLANQDTVSFTINITDDAIIEGNETLFVAVTAVTSGLTIGTSNTMIFVVEDNDYRTADISSITTVDANLVPDSLGKTFITHGVVYTDDFDGNAGHSFYMYDNTGGINVFNFVDVSGYTVTRGDSIRVIGEIAQFRGLTEIIVDSIAVLKTGIALKTATTVSVLDETTEGEFIHLSGWNFVDTTQWTPGAGSGFNVDITNGTDTFIMRIDNDINLFNMPLPTSGVFDVYGAGSQFSTATPANNGYQIFPRDSADIIINVSLKEIAGPKISVYPNPVSNAVFVERDNNVPAKVTITTITGAVVRFIATDNKLIEIETSNLTSGTYIISVEVDGAKTTRKIVVR